MKAIILLFLLTASLGAISQDSQQRFEEIARANFETRQWQVLLHYKKSILGTYKSEADGPRFFFSPDGRRDPMREMIASAEAMSREGLAANPDHPQCAFPARYKYIKKTFNLAVEDVECQEHKWWRENLPFKSVSVIFASYYANNPSSIFGHTFLRINSSDTKSISDYGVDFTAITNTDHGVEFAVRGLIGGYIGLFSLKPYYMKMNEYLENENRDLWEYDLNLSAAQIETMLDHLWELQKNTYFDYYFLDENCSYQLLTLLEVANPDWSLSDEFVWKTIPIDSVKKIIETSGAVSGFSYRPAYKKSAQQKVDFLNGSELTRMRKILTYDLAPTAVSEPRVLEAAIATLRYERFEYKKFKEKQKSLLNALLIHRASVGGKVDYPELKDSLPIEKMRPDKSHDSEKYSFGYGNNTSIGRYTELAVKGAMNDLLDVDDGYPAHSLIDMAKLKLRYSDENKNVYFEELKYAEVISLFPLDGNEFRWSWRAGGKSYRIYDGSCDLCVGHQLKSGFGLAGKSRMLDTTVYGLVLIDGQLSNEFYRGYRIAPVLNLGAVSTISERWKATYDLEVGHELNRATSYRDLRMNHQIGVSYNLRLQHELRATFHSASLVKKVNPVDELQLTYSFYY
jgi:hypothetical protein